MRTIEGSSRGRGLNNHRGRGGRGGRGGHRGGGGGRGGVSDPRFNSRFTDPRFQLSKNNQQRRMNPRAELSRAALEDPRFAKRLPKKMVEEHLIVPEDNDHDDHDDHDEEEEEKQESDPENFEEEDAEEVDSEAERALDDEVNAWAPDDVEYIEPQRRLAVVNCDWDHVRAVDLYAVLFHALPLGGRLLEVNVYLSDLGKKMIEHERIYGPDLWAKPDEAQEGEVDGENGGEPGITSVEELPEDLSDDEASEVRSDGWVDDNPIMMEEQGEDGEYFSEGKYRQYEMSRMKYYYAVATFDSPDTAAAVYDALDGMDIEASGVVLDLRYIDEEETFEDAPVSHADCVPPNFKPLTSFKSAALTQSRFRISWDQDDVFRHHSVQDAFTGTTEEDDMAAYLAPPDSDDDEADPTTGRSKTEEKMRIRRKYAHLLQEIGGLADEPEGDGDDKPNEDDEEESASSGSGSDDDDLNRFSDIEEDDDDENESEEGDGKYDVVGNLESTMDLGADSRAIGLQQETRRKQKMKDGTLATQAELKYKQRRKEMKKTKKEMVLQEKEDAKAQAAAEREQQRDKLREIVGPDGETTQMSGKERRKLHAKKVKERVAQERVDRKQMRAAARLGVQREAQQKKEVQEADKAMGAIDSRFSNKLLSDPRFNLDVGQKDRRVAEELVDLAKTVSKARKAKRDRPVGSGDAPATKQSKQESISGVVDYFLSKPSKK